MSKPKVTDLADLTRILNRVLDAPSGLTQEEVAEKCGFDQGFISRVKNGEIVRETNRTRILRRVLEAVYANMRKRRAATPREVSSAVGDYLAAGGNPDLLVRQLELLRTAQVRPLRSARFSERRRKDH